jgi:hypothetical protein
MAKVRVVPDTLDLAYAGIVEGRRAVELSRLVACARP